MFEDFATFDVELTDAVIHARVGSHGPALLLLHGYPETHAMWHQIAPELAKDHQVVAADLRGYGDSIAKSDDFSFRAMANDMTELMTSLGHEQFHVVAHDRGARTAHRMLLDHPHRILSVALLDILPTLTVWRLMDQWLAQRYYHWLFLSQPAPMPQRLINADPITFLHAALGGLSGPIDMFDPAVLAEYERAARKPSVVEAWCADYRAATGIDLEHDTHDLGRHNDVPALILWGSKGVVAAQTDPLQAWRPWLPKLTGGPVQAGHFLAEERPHDVLAALHHHLQHTATHLT